MRENIKSAIDLYSTNGVPTGGFLRAVLANDLMEAMGRADEENRLDIFEICQYVYNDIPANSHGSYKKVDDWMERKQEEVKVFDYLEEKYKDSKL